jgi:hypothetical protein
VEVPRQIDVMKDNKLALRISIKAITPAKPDDSKNFKLKGHEWQRQFTAEAR